MIKTTTVLLAIVAGVSSLVASGAGAGTCSARFNCGMGASPQCYFAVMSRGQYQRVVVPAGQSRMVYGVQPGAYFCTATRFIPNLRFCPTRRLNMSCR